MLTRVANRDDVVQTSLSPSDSYKTVRRYPILRRYIRADVHAMWRLTERPLWSAAHHGPRSRLSCFELLEVRQCRQSTFFGY